MGFTKNKAWSIVIALIALIVFNIFAFAIPANHNIAYWMGYSFAVFANIVLVFTAVISLNKPNLKETFFGLPSLTVAWIYFIVQTILSILQMYYLNHPYFIGLIINLLLGASTIIVLILANMAVEEIKETDEKIAEKVW